jgi:alpha-glucosidase (family GH31 glycosyl hydrolase)
MIMGCHMRARNLVLGIAFALAIGQVARPQEAVVGIDLGGAVNHPPRADYEWAAGLTLDHFLLANGERLAAAPTFASLLWDDTALYVRFHCTDPDAIYRAGVRLARTDRVEISLLPPGAPERELWQFSAEQNGSAFSTHAGIKAELQGATVTLAESRWTAQLTIPWAQVGGLPAQTFHLQLARVRFLTGEVSSPSAVDFHDGPVSYPQTPLACDEFMEATLGGRKSVQTAGFGLIRLPSGARRWEPRALLHHASAAELKDIAQLQQDLRSKPTDQANLEDRVRLAQIWYDLLDQEGVSFHPESGTWLLNEGELDPWNARHQFNNALAQGDAAKAGRILDSLLRHFDRLSASWFADGTPGDVRDEAWAPVGAIESAEAAKDEIVLHALAGGRKLDLFLSFPVLGGIRLHGPEKGLFTPPAPTAPAIEKAAQGIRARAQDLTVDIGLKTDWHISLTAAAGTQAVWSLHAGDLRVRLDAKGGIAAIDLGGALSPGESIFGLGERFDSLNQRGKTLTLWQQDAWDCLVQGGLKNQAYKPIPLWHSTAGYSVFWNTTYEIRADFGKAREDRYRLTAHGPILDLYIWPGDYRQVLRTGYTALTGRPVLPPVWAFEPWMGGGGGRWARNRGVTPTQTMLDEAAHFQRLDIPHSAIYAEGPGSSDPLLYRKLEPLNIRVLTWGRSQPLGWNLDTIKTALPDVPPDKLPLMRLAGGKVFGFPAHHILSGQFPYYDFTDPRALDLLRAYSKPLLDLGVAGSMVDFGDLVPREALFHDGRSGEEMHNGYAYLYHRAVRRVFEERRGDNYILFSRGGAAGSQAELCQMAGDHASNFRGLDESIAGGLSIGASGFSCWGVDVGGYAGKADEEVYIRWVEYGAFSPLMRFHGTEPREPWYYSDSAVDIYKKYVWLRENLVPYIYGSAQDAHTAGVPIMRALPPIEDEYMFGDDLLVAPVHTPGERRTITLPKGNWTSFWTGEPVAGGTREFRAPLGEIPVFLRAGALVPVQVAPDLELGESMSAGRVPALLLTPPEPAASHHTWVLPQEQTPARLESVAGKDGFQVNVENWPGLRYLLVSGLRSRVTGVKADGESLMVLDRRATETLPPGWERIGENRVLVRLPVSVKHVVLFSTAQ